MTGTGRRHIQVDQQTDDAGDAAGDEIAQHESQKEWYRLPVSLAPAVFENDGLCEPAYHDREPEIYHAAP